MIAEKSNIASFDVDAQKGFTPLCPEELPVAGGHEIAEELNYLSTQAGLRVGSKDAHSRSAHWMPGEGKPAMTPIQGGGELDFRCLPHCVVGEKGYELLDELPDEMDYDFFVYKGVSPELHPYGACYHNRTGVLRSTGVIEFLKQNKVETVLVGGLATDYCVKETAIQLARAGFRVIVHIPACRGIAQDLSAALAEMREAGVVLCASRQELEGLLNAKRPTTQPASRRPF